MDELLTTLANVVIVAALVYEARNVHRNRDAIWGYLAKMQEKHDRHVEYERAVAARRKAGDAVDAAYGHSGWRYAAMNAVADIRWDLPNSPVIVWGDETDRSSRGVHRA